MRSNPSIAVLYAGRLIIGGILFTASAHAAPLDPNGFTSLGTLNVASGALNINTDTLLISGAASFSGVAHTQGSTFQPEVAVFTFDEIDIAAGVTIAISGARPLALLSQGDATIAAMLDVRGVLGGSGNSGIAGTGGAGGSGGSAGGSAWTTVVQGRPAQPGIGPGGGLSSGGGGFGGAGGAAAPSTTGTSGPAYGNLGIALEGGSGGSAGNGSSSGVVINGPGGGGGGGAIEIGAIGVLSVANIDARGAAGGSAAPPGIGQQATFTGAGGGSGGAIFLHGSSVNVSGAITAIGGNGTTATSAITRAGGGGGGGRVRVEFENYVIGAVAPAVNLAGGTSSVSPPGTLRGSPGIVGVAELVPLVTVIPSGVTRQLNSDGTSTGSVTSQRRRKRTDQRGPGAHVHG